MLAALLWFFSDRSARKTIRRIGVNQSSGEARANIGRPSREVRKAYSANMKKLLFPLIFSILAGAALGNEQPPAQNTETPAASSPESSVLSPLDTTSTLTDLRKRVFTVKDFKGFGLMASALGNQKEFTFKIRVAPGLPIYAIHVVSASDPPGHIDVYRGKAMGAPLQVFKLGPDTFLGGNPSVFNVADINFDGYADIGIVVDGGALWSAYQYWVYDKQTGTFKQTPVTEDFKAISFGYRLAFDTKTKQVIATGPIGAVGGYRNTYQFKNGRLLPLIEIEQLNRVVDDKKARANHPTIHCSIKTKRHTGNTTKTTTQILNKACPGFPPHF